MNVKKRLLDGARMNRAIRRMAIETVEKNRGITDLIIVGVNQSQRAGSDMWWRADLQAAAEKAAAEKGALEHKNCDNAMQHNCDNAVDTIWKNHGRLSGSPLMADGLRRGRGDLKKGRWCPRSMAATSDRS